MVAPTDHPNFRKRALVVQRDPKTRKQICEQLIDRGFQVDACATLAEARATYGEQQLVVANTERDPATPRGFIAWLREQSGSEDDPPYILVVSDREASMRTPPQNRDWDELLTTPLDSQELRSRIEAIETWVEHRVSSQSQPADLPAEPIPQAQPEPEVTLVRPASPQTTGRTPSEPRVMVRPKFAKAGSPKAPPKKLATPAPQLPQPTPMARPSANDPTTPSLEDQPLIQLAKTPPRPDASLDLTGSLSAAEQFQALLDNSPNPMAMLDRDLNYRAANERWARDFRLQSDQIRGRSFYEVFPSMHDEWRKAHQRALQGTPTKCDRDEWTQADGATHDVRWEVQPWINGKKEVRGITISCELLEQAPTTAAGFDAGQIGRSLLGGKVTPALCLNLEGKIEQASTACQAYVENPAAELRGELFWNAFCTAAQRDQLKIEFLAAAKETREREYFAFPTTFVTPVMLPAGGETTLAWSNSPNYDGGGKITGVISVGVPLGDGTALFTAVENARQGRQQLPVSQSAVFAEKPEAILEQVSFGIILLDAQRNTLYANPEHRAMLGYDVETFDDIEDWLLQASPAERQSQALLENWRNNVWQKQVTKVFTLRTREKVLREIEFRPRPTADGGLMLTLFDVTERRRGEEAMRASEAKFRALFREAGVGISLEDRTGAIFDANPLFEQMSGVSRADLRRGGMKERVNAEDWSKIAAYLAVVESSNGNLDPLTTEIRLNRANANELWTRVSVSRVADHTGSLIYTAYFFQDISSEQKATSSLESARQEQRALLNAVPDPILMLDRTGRILDLIPSSTGLLVNSADEAFGKNLADFIPSLEGSLAQFVEQAISQGSILATGIELRAADHQIRQLEARIVGCGEERAVLVLQDVTAVHQAREVLNRHALTFDHTCDGIVITDLGGKITDWNPASERMFGYERPEILGIGLATLFSPNDRANFNRKVAEALSTEGSWSGSAPFFRKDGTQGIAEVYYVAVEQTQGHPTSVLGINREVSALSKTKNLDGSEPDAAALRHRMRNDLQTIISLTSLQLGFAGTTEVRYMLRQNQERIKVIALVHDLLESSGSSKSAINLSTYLQMLRSSLTAAFSVSPEDITIRVECPQIMIPSAKALSVGLIASEFLTEILRNAVAHGKSGAVSIRVTIAESAVDFRIEDDGLGFPDNLSRLDGNDLSMEIIRTLAEQLDAEFSLVAGKRPTAALRFPVDV